MSKEDVFKILMKPQVSNGPRFLSTDWVFIMMKTCLKLSVSMLMMMIRINALMSFSEESLIPISLNMNAMKSDSIPLLSTLLREENSRWKFNLFTDQPVKETTKKKFLIKVNLN